MAFTAFVSLLSGLFLTGVASADTRPNGQPSDPGTTHVFVCKYVGTPGVDEVLKAGKQPIYVSSSATAGTWFNDAQGRSFVLAVADESNTGQGETYTGEATCPAADNPGPQPTPQVLTGEKGKTTCDGVFTQTITVTTPYVLVDGTWVLDTKNATTVPGDWTFVRALTSPERAELGCTTPSATYVVAVWSMPSWVGPQTPTWPQTLVGSVPSTTVDLSAADSIIPTTCGTQYQVDVYNDNQITTDLLAGRHLDGPNSPPESLVPGGWGTAYKLVKNPDCAPPVVVTPVAPTLVAPTCDAPGSVDVPDITGVTYTDNKDGTWTATPQPGYRFDNESQSVTFTAGIPAPQLVCTAPVPPTPTAEVTTTCANASVTLHNPTSGPVTFTISGGSTQQTHQVAAGQALTVSYPETGTLSSPFTVYVFAGNWGEIQHADSPTTCVEGIVIPGTKPPTTAKPPAVEPAVVPAAAPPAELPHTGAGSLPLALAGGGLLLLGTVLVASTRRRRGDLAA